MFLKELVLENIRSYEHAHVRFPEGSVMLSGDIGSGKSSLLLAIEFALFGTKKSELPASVLLRHGAQTGSVQLTFTLEGKEYQIKRNLKRTRGSIKQTEGYLAVEGVKKRMMPEELRAAVIKVLGYPEEEMKKSKDMIYRFTVYTPQELMKQILYESSEQRKETLRKVFGMEKYKQIQEQGELLKRLYKTKIRGWQPLIQDLPELKEKEQTLKKDLRAAEECYEKAKQEEKEKEEKVKQAQQTKENAEKKYKQLQQEEQTLQLLQQQQQHLLLQIKKHKAEEEALKKKITILEEQLASLNLPKPLEEKEQLQQQRDAFVKEQQQKKHHYQVLQEKKAFILKQIDQIQEEIKKIEQVFLTEEKKPKAINQETVDVLRKEIETLEKQFQTLQKKKAVLEATLEEDKKVLENIASYQICPFCKQTIHEDHKQQLKQEYEYKQQQTEEELTFLQKQFDEIHQQLQQKQQDFEEAKKALVVWEAWLQQEKQRALMQETIKRKKQMREALQEELETINHQLKKREEADDTELLAKQKALEEKLEQWKQWEIQEQKKQLLQQQHQELQQTIANIQKEKKEIALQLTELGEKIAAKEPLLKEKEAAEKTWRAAQQHYEEAWQQLQEKSKQTAAAQQQFQQYQQLLQQVQEKRKEKEHLQEKIHKLERFLDWLEKAFLPLIVLMEKQLMATIYTEFNELFQQWFTLLIEDETMQVKLDEDFQPVIEQNGYETAIENLSGGERQALALAYRLALNKVINDIVSHVKTKDVLILDEPTDGFSSQQMDKIRDVLEQANVKQIILVSHEPKLESYVDYIIRVIKEDHQSKVIMQW